MINIIKTFMTLLLLFTFSQSAFAHEGVGIAGGFLSGFLHPITGFDHLAAMVAVGLWGAFLGQPSIWLLPVLFPMLMAVGGVLGILGVPVPAVEFGIALSAVLLGGAVATAAKPPIWIAAIVVSFFAMFHGHAHGTELPESANALAYSVAFVISTGLLHVAGIAFGSLVRWPRGKIAVQVMGAIIAVLGVGFLGGVI